MNRDATFLYLSPCHARIWLLHDVLFNYLVQQMAEGKLTYQHTDVDGTSEPTRKKRRVATRVEQPRTVAAHFRPADVSSVTEVSKQLCFTDYPPHKICLIINLRCNLHRMTKWLKKSRKTSKSFQKIDAIATPNKRPYLGLCGFAGGLHSSMPKNHRESKESKLIRENMNYLFICDS